MNLTQKEIDLLKSLIIDKKQEFENLLNKLNNNVIQNTESFIDKYKHLNQSDLNWLIDILNPNQYEKVESKSDKTDFFYKKDGKIYMLQETETDVWWLDYTSIYSVFKSKFGDNYQLFKELTKGILLNTYKCKVQTTKWREVLGGNDC